MSNEEKTCRNRYEGNPVDGFWCSECGFAGVVSRYDEDAETGEPDDSIEIQFETPRCPSCGRRVEDDERVAAADSLEQIARVMFENLTTEWLGLDEIEVFKERLEALGVDATHPSSITDTETGEIKHPLQERYAF